MLLLGAHTSDGTSSIGWSCNIRKGKALRIMKNVNEVLDFGRKFLAATWTPNFMRHSLRNIQKIIISISDIYYCNMSWTVSNFFFHRRSTSSITVFLFRLKTRNNLAPLFVGFWTTSLPDYDISTRRKKKSNLAPKPIICSLGFSSLKPCETEDDQKARARAWPGRLRKSPRNLFSSSAWSHVSSSYHLSVSSLLYIVIKKER